MNYKPKMQTLFLPGCSSAFCANRTSWSSFDQGKRPSLASCDTESSNVEESVGQKSPGHREIGAQGDARLAAWSANRRPQWTLESTSAKPDRIGVMLYVRAGCAGGDAPRQEPIIYATKKVTALRRRNRFSD
jgi:hypothetical protein